MNSLIEILRGMSKRPGFYLTHSPATIGQLRTFLVGVQVGRRCGNDLTVLDAFDEWVLWRHGVPELSADWSGHILHQASGDDEAAFHLFFKYLEEYLVERE